MKGKDVNIKKTLIKFTFRMIFNNLSTWITNPKQDKLLCHVTLLYRHLEICRF